MAPSAARTLRVANLEAEAVTGDGQEVSDIEGDHPSRPASHGAFEHHVVVRIRQRRPPPKLGRHLLHAGREDVEDRGDIFGTRPACRQHHFPREHRLVLGHQRVRHQARQLAFDQAAQELVRGTPARAERRDKDVGIEDIHRRYHICHHLLAQPDNQRSCAPFMIPRTGRIVQLVD